MLFESRWVPVASGQEPFQVEPPASGPKYCLLRTLSDPTVSSLSLCFCLLNFSSSGGSTSLWCHHFQIPSLWQSAHLACLGSLVQFPLLPELNVLEHDHNSEVAGGGVEAKGWCPRSVFIPLYSVFLGQHPSVKLELASLAPACLCFPCAGITHSARFTHSFSVGAGARGVKIGFASAAMPSTLLRSHLPHPCRHGFC